MQLLSDLISGFLVQLQSPTLGFLLGGMLVAALGSKLSIPDAAYRFIVFVLLMTIGMEGGIEIRHAAWGSMLLPALFAAAIGLLIVLLGSLVFAILPGIKRQDGIATAGLFGAVSASTLAAAMFALNEQDTFYEAWVPALYPFMDIPALVLAIVLAKLQIARSSQSKAGKTRVRDIIKESLQGSALSALLLGLGLGLFTRPDSVLESFYQPVFRGFLSVLMLILGMEAYSRLSDLKQVAHWYAVYGVLAPIVHGLIGFGFGYLAHMLVGFSPGGVVLLSVIAASSSDISGPPTIRGGIPSANPSTYIGASTGLATPIAIAVCIPLFISLAQVVF